MADLDARDDVRAGSRGPVEERAEQRVTPLELFFDLVFVFSLTQVTGLMADDPTWAGLARGMAILAALWWPWVGYAWLTNAVPVEERTPARLVVVGAMAAVMVAALAVPGAFGKTGVVFGLALVVVTVLHSALYVLATRTDNPDVSVAIFRLAPGFVAGPLLLVAAGFADGAAQAALWAASLATSYGVALVLGVEGFSVSPGHFVERHGLIMIIALGESIVAVGVGASGGDLGPGVVLAAVLAVVVAAGLWWTYFDHVSLAAERQLERARGPERATLARDSYSYLHLPMVAGIILIALGIKKTLEHIGDPLEPVPAFALCGGVALYLLGHNAFRLRDHGTVSAERLVAAAVALVLLLPALFVPALLSLGLLAVLLTALAAYETLGHKELRARLRNRG
ncbi:low temperature requirement protein A [Rubrobacter tropicus]|uniref:Low temperature requirement protein A n=1 Tax=Rubrobacter tropicus TaxID=2653851 RepID=A0A6G8Q7X7_9ACTN|nr:low temperature requirement protein A [Rubrobacter tropicus]QIN82553.1 low temperature requirement protein A [Rubrobacter tropicus]